MLRVFQSGCLSLLVVALLTMPVSADVVLSMDSAGNTNFDTGVAGSAKLLSIYIAQDSASSDTMFVLVADYMLQSGVVTGGQVSATGATGTAGFYGAGDLSTSDFTITGTDSFNVNQEMTSGSHPIMNEPAREKWLDFEIDTTGLASGTYTIDLLAPAGTFADPGFDFLTANNNLTFTVSNIPEPGSLGVLVLFGVCAIGRRRR